MITTLRKFELLLEVGNHARFPIDSKESLVYAHRNFMSDFAENLFNYPTASKQSMEKYASLIGRIVDAKHKNYLQSDNEVVVDYPEKDADVHVVAFFDEDFNKINVVNCMGKKELIGLILSRSIIPMREDFSELEKKGCE